MSQTDGQMEREMDRTETYMPPACWLDNYSSTIFLLYHITKQPQIQRIGSVTQVYNNVITFIQGFLLNHDDICHMPHVAAWQGQTLTESIQGSITFRSQYIYYVASFFRWSKTLFLDITFNTYHSELDVQENCASMANKPNFKPVVRKENRRYKKWIYL